MPSAARCSGIQRLTPNVRRKNDQVKRMNTNAYSNGDKQETPWLKTSHMQIKVPETQPTQIPAFVKTNLLVVALPLALAALVNGHDIAVFLSIFVSRT